MTQPRPLLTKAVAAAAQGEDKRYELRHKTVSGLRLIVQTSGVKTWAVRYMAATGERRLVLGNFPTIGLADAVKLASAAKREVSLGGDPAAAKVEARRLASAVASKGTSFVTNWKAYCLAPKPKSRNRKQWRKASREQADRLFRQVEPLWAKRRVDEIKKHDVRDFIDEVAADHPHAASRALAVLTSFFNWCLKRDLIVTSPCKDIERPAKPNKGKRKLTDDEIRWLWQASGKQPFPLGDIVRLLILTIARRTEVSGICRCELHLGNQRAWIVPAVRAKNNQEHSIYLTDAMLAVIRAIPIMQTAKGKPTYVFTTNGRTSFTGYSKAKKSLDALMLQFAKAEDPEVVAIPNWTLHDLRRTGSTRMQRLGFDTETVDACLNHISEDNYRQHDYAPEMVRAFEAWSLEVQRIVSAKPAGRAATLVPALHSDEAFIAVGNK